MGLHNPFKNIVDVVLTNSVDVLKVLVRATNERSNLGSRSTQIYGQETLGDSNPYPPNKTIDELAASYNWWRYGERLINPPTPGQPYYCAFMILNLSRLYHAGGVRNLTVNCARQWSSEGGAFFNQVYIDWWAFQRVVDIVPVASSSAYDAQIYITTSGDMPLSGKFHSEGVSLSGAGPYSYSANQQISLNLSNLVVS